MAKSKIVVSSKVGKNYVADMIIYCIGQKVKDKPFTSPLINQVLKNAVKLGDFKGAEADLIIDYEPDKTAPLKNKRTAFIGIGSIAERSKEYELHERLRTAGGNIAKICKKTRAKRIAIFLPEPLIEKHGASIFGSLTEGVLLGNYTFDKYKSDQDKKSSEDSGIKELRFVTDKNVHKIRRLLSLAQNGVDSACDARDMANEPGSNWTPLSFAEYAQDIANKYELKCTILEKKKLEKMGMGGIIGVNRGSAIPPKLVILQYTASPKAKTLLLVGKGLTFDSGGVSLKPASGMEDMKYDMCGGAAVISTMLTVGREKPKCNVIAMIPTTDNMSGGAALKPGDIICHYNKMTSEIINTDAEGRLILADALSYGVEKFSPDMIVDLATLTGAVIIGLGHHHSGILSNNDGLAKKLIKAGKSCGEPLWQLPLGKEYKKQLESKVADMKNSGGRPAGTITAAEYLHHFVGDTPWAHIDIAGTAWGFTEKSYVPKGGPSGYGVRTLVDFIRNLD